MFDGSHLQKSFPLLHGTIKETLIRLAVIAATKRDMEKTRLHLTRSVTFSLQSVILRFCSWIIHDV